MIPEKGKKYAISFQNEAWHDISYSGASICSASWIDFHGGARMKLYKRLAIEVQQGKMPNAPWYWYGVGGISRDDRVGGYPTKKEAQLAAVEHARSELSAALNSLPNARGDTRRDEAGLQE